jgi:SAM-dependent methyltransferase
MTETLDHLHRLYANTDDPWEFANSAYEQGRFTATREALLRDSYRSALEIGCGNGALAAHLAPICGRYTGIDAIQRAVDSARHRVPGATFHVGCYPCLLPGAGHDLVILSEVLYFLTPGTILQLADDVVRCAPGAEVLCITFLGDTEQALQGVESLDLLRAALRPHMALKPVADSGRYRIDRGLMGVAYDARA